jgi:hypothetical protein
MLMLWGIGVTTCVAGTYGLLEQRTRELGLQISFDVQHGDIAVAALRQARWMLVVESGVGFVLAYLTSLLFRTLLYGVRPYDPWTMGTVCASAAADHNGSDAGTWS